jgi:hypothetical protein
VSDREHTRALRDFRSEARPSNELRFVSIPPWDATVRVDYLDVAGIGRRLQVSAGWTGPPLPGTPPATGPVSASDTYMCEADETELAFALANRARDDLAAARVPDLRAIAKRLRHRADAG